MPKTKIPLRRILFSGIFGVSIVAGSAVAGIALLKKDDVLVPLASPPAPRFPRPFLAKGVYLPADAAARPAKVASTIELINQSEALNAVVIDIKDSSGVISYPSKVSRAVEIESGSSRIPDIFGVLSKFHEADIYVIGRITVFQDPVFAQMHPEWAVHSKKKKGGLWYDNRGLGWMDPAAQHVWVYAADLAKEAHDLGFDEINFDYVRFPSDGLLGDMQFPIWDEKSTPHKYEVIAQFFSYLDSRLRGATPRVPISVDIFGMTFWRGGEDDLNIGQRLEDALPHFDYIQPMLYPSHFPATFQGFKNPAEHPGEIVSGSLEQKKKIFEGSQAKMRPWLQDFNLGAKYTAALVAAQIAASDAQGAFGWTFWNPNGTYTKEAFVPGTAQ